MPEVRFLNMTRSNMLMARLCPPSNMRFSVIDENKELAASLVARRNLKAGEATEEDALLDSDVHRGRIGTGNSYKHWWPGIGRWKISLIIDYAMIGFPEEKRWDKPDE